MTSFIFDTLIVFLLIYAVIDLAQQGLYYLTRLWNTTQSDACVLLLRLKNISADDAEETLRRAIKTNFPLWLITDDAEDRILFMAERLCRNANNVSFYPQAELFEKLNLAKAPICFEEDSKEAVPFPDK